MYLNVLLPTPPLPEAVKKKEVFLVDGSHYNDPVLVLGTVDRYEPEALFPIRRMAEISPQDGITGLVMNSVEVEGAEERAITGAASIRGVRLVVNIKQCGSTSVESDIIETAGC
jgi:hypothetical protein